MLLNWFDAREAVELGRSLADHLGPQTVPGPAAPSKRGKPSDQLVIETFLRRVDQEAGSLQLNLYKRAKLANSFKWRLLETGFEQRRVAELTQMLLLRLSRSGASLPQAVGVVSPPPKRANSSHVHSLLVQGNEFAAKGLYAEAISSFQELLTLDPGHAFAHNNLGAVHIKLGHYEEAEREFSRAIELKRNYPDALSNLATVLRWKGLILESETPLRRALKLSPQHVEARVSLGLTLILVGRLRDAKECFEKALKIAPRNVDAWVGLAEIAGLEGRFEEAEALLKRALEVDPKSASAWAALPGLRKMSRSDAAWIEGAERIAADGLPLIEETTLRYAMGKYWDDLKDFPRAFRDYQRANELQKMAATPYDRSARTNFVDDLIRAYTSEALACPDSGASNSERPVFVVGMMRSGTSLVEQIIASHPAAKGAGELEFWNGIVRKHEDILRRQLPSDVQRLKWAESYLQTLMRYSADALRVVDKSTVNSDHLGVIHSVFPRARILYLRRNPIDTCLSCYFQQFAPSLNFTMDLSDLAHYYREHQRLVGHWRAVLPPGTLLEVPYAELVAEQESWTRKILDFLGLPWDPRCLTFHETQRAVMTASSWQVRQKMYRGSVGRWHNYEKFISPLRQLAGPDDR